MYQPDESWIMELTAGHGIVDPKDLARNLRPTEKAAIPISPSRGDPIIPRIFRSHSHAIIPAGRQIATRMILGLSILIAGLVEAKYVLNGAVHTDFT